MINKNIIKKTLKDKLPSLYHRYNNYKNNKILINYFNTSFQKNVLISYITYPFERKSSLRHTNVIESLKIADEFRDLGYNCDIVNYNSDIKIDYRKYNVIFGFGKPFHNSFSLTSKTTRIFYGTGRHPYYNNQATVERGIDFLKNKNHFLISSLRLIEEDYTLQINASDALILLGGEDVKQNYIKYSSNRTIFNLNTSFFKIHNYKEFVENRNYEESRNNFLFFSGGGMIHKGLDMLLDIFKDRKDINLFVCAPIENEKEFKEIYKNELFKTNNIHFKNFVNLDSEEFKDLIKKCCFVILPSCSEVLPTSIINVVGNGGLIPILSYPSTINLDENCIMIEKNDLKSIVKAIEISINLTVDTLKETSLKIAEKINAGYSIENFVENFRNTLKKII